MTDRVKNVFYKVLIALLGLVILSVVVCYLILRLSLPQVSGELSILGLSNKVTVSRDNQGMATLSADNRLDLAYALGVIHAQERFFQMDLLRRNSAGELSALFGEVALQHDKNMRLHRFRSRAKANLDLAEPKQLAIIKAYTAGVNQGIEALTTKPFEYYLLNAPIKPWSYEDSGLVMYSMYLDLQGRDARREINLSLMQNTLAADLFAFLTPKGTRWDAAIDDSQYSPASLAQSTWPKAPEKSVYQWNMDSADWVYGSNNWAVAAGLTDDGRAIVANDMHLGIGVPNIWYRATLKWREGSENKMISGVTLPGTPAVVVGSNTKVAWGFTNSQGDWSDVIKLRVSEDGSQYQNATSLVDFTEYKEVIHIKGGSQETVTVKETEWGPVITTDHQGYPIVHRWVAHDSLGLNINLMKMENANTVQQAFALANTFGQPGQNLMVADKDGNIGWTIAGPIPKRGTAAQSVADFWDSPGAGWQGYLTPDEYPRVYNPDHHRLWTANARVVGEKMLAKVGTGGYALGARQQQIRDGLFALESADESAMFALQLDNKAVFLSRWRDLMLKQVLNAKDHLQAHTALLNWSGHAAIDDPGYAIVRHFRVIVREMVFEQLANALMATDPDFRLWTVWHHFEAPLWQMMTEQPQHLLPDGYANWPDLLNQAWQKTISDLTKEQTQPIKKWGEYNATNIRHPLSRAVPLLGYFTDMPTQAQAGDSYMPLVASPTHGSSQRMVVAPGQEERGIMQMPSSQSGHPLSPFYGKGHDEWLNGVATPFLGGKGQYELILQPAN